MIRFHSININQLIQNSVKLIINSKSLTSTSCSIANMPSARRHSYDLNVKSKIVADNSQ